MALPISCSLAKDLLKNNSCGYSLPEIKDIYIANLNDISGTNVNYDCTSGVTVDDISFTGTGAQFYHVQPEKGSASFTDELVVDDNGKKHRTHTVVFTLPGKYDKDAVCPIDALSLGKFVVVIETADGEHLMLGREVGLEATEGTNAGGGDTNGSTITLAADMAESIIPVTDDVFKNKVKA